MATKDWEKFRDEEDRVVWRNKKKDIIVGVFSNDSLGLEGYSAVVDKSTKVPNIYLTPKPRGSGSPGTKVTKEQAITKAKAYMKTH